MRKMVNDDYCPSERRDQAAGHQLIREAPPYFFPSPELIVGQATTRNTEKGKGKEKGDGFIFDSFLAAQVRVIQSGVLTFRKSPAQTFYQLLIVPVESPL